MDTWFEIVLTIYGLIYLIMMFSNEDEPELTEEMRKKLYS